MKDMEKMKIISVVGARPNFVKIAPFLKELKKHKGIENILVHTGQHYTDYMSEFFLRDFKISKYIMLKVSRVSPEKQILQIQEKFTKVLRKEKPDLVVVVGDVNSTRACALAASGLKIKVAHIEAGLRSFDKTMPEEINRIITDSVSDFLFITEPSALKNLAKEGIPRKKIFFVGNIMIDSLIANLKEARKKRLLPKFGLDRKEFALLTIHRPSNVDKKSRLARIVRFITDLQKITKTVYPAHPRTVKMLKKFHLLERLRSLPNLLLIDPLGYIDFLSLMVNAKCLITDSGGIQEETTYLGIPCFTLRKNTERPITITLGTNILIADDYTKLLSLIKRLPLERKTRRPKFWDGKTAVRIVKVLKKSLLVFILMLCGIGAAEAKEVKVVTSFYPLYIMALNVTKDVPQVTVSNLTPSINGCLHDYVLSTTDMQRLAEADIFIANGSGMEGFLENVTKQYPRIQVVKLTDRIPLIDDNPHVWLSISGAIMQVKNLGIAMEGFDPERAELYQKNTDAYVVKLEKLGLKMYSALAPYKGAKIITLHDAFPYFAQEFGLEIMAVVEREPGAEPSAKELGEIIELIKKEGVKAIFSDQWYPSAALDTISRETGAPVYFINTAVSGDNDPGAYIATIQSNIDTLREALK